QRGYLLHFSGAKKSETRIRRIEKHMSNIFEGIGLHDRY
ncbi:MAG: YdeI/OmpD-associated family protein, partial [Chloroflexota bacterium]